MKHLHTTIKQGLTAEQLTKALPYISGVVKQVMGVANNVAQVAMFNARDDLMRHPRYRQQTKQAFNQAFKAWENYERGLLHPVGLRYFHVADMPPEVRKRYGDITDRDFFEFWQNVGWSVYSKHRNFITMMDNKFKLSLQKHGVAHAELLCRAMTAEQLLMIACTRYNDVRQTVKRETGIRLDDIDLLFGSFRLDKVHERWTKAMEMIVPNFPLEETEDKNLRMSVGQLYEIIADIPKMYEGIEQSAEDYEEIFRTKGEWKKVRREIREDWIETNKLLEA